jgi:hypothetical protein
MRVFEREGHDAACMKATGLLSSSRCIDHFGADDSRGVDALIALGIKEGRHHATRVAQRFLDSPAPHLLPSTRHPGPCSIVAARIPKFIRKVRTVRARHGRLHLEASQYTIRELFLDGVLARPISDAVPQRNRLPFQCLPSSCCACRDQRQASMCRYLASRLSVSQRATFLG